MSLRLDFCSYEAAKYACEHWHYSKVLPAGKRIQIGVWENDQYIGCVIFSRGANNNIGKPFRLQQTEICELTRIALRQHKTEVTRIVSIAISILKRTNDGLKLIVSYADPAQGHEGKIYKAGNWEYLGKGTLGREVMLMGKIVHKRTINSRYGTAKGLVYGPLQWKHKYIYWLDKDMRTKHRERCNGKPAGEGVSIRPVRSK